MSYSFFFLEKKEQTLWLWLNRPEKRNFLNRSFWQELPLVVEEIQKDSSIKVLVLAAKGNSFSMGLDLKEFSLEFGHLLMKEGAKVRHEILALIEKMQSGLIKLLELEIPVVCAIQRHCIGGGLDLALCADVRFCSQDAIFSLRESEVHIVADMGALQLLPYVIGEAQTREWAFTGRDILAQEALQLGLVSQIFPTKEELWQKTAEYCERISLKDPLVLRGIKFILNHRRLESIKASLREVALYNSAFLQNESFLDLIKNLGQRKK